MPQAISISASGPPLASAQLFSGPFFASAYLFFGLFLSLAHLFSGLPLASAQRFFGLYGPWPNSLLDKASAAPLQRPLVPEVVRRQLHWQPPLEEAPAGPPQGYPALEAALRQPPLEEAPDGPPQGSPAPE
ncbi:MAG: hypothetical protein ACK56I_27420, partial [bacterium]